MANDGKIDSSCDMRKLDWYVADVSFNSACFRSNAGATRRLVERGGHGHCLVSGFSLLGSNKVSRQVSATDYRRIEGGPYDVSPKISATDKA